MPRNRTLAAPALLAAVVALVAAVAAAPLAHARVIRAEAVLPPGQSGFVSLTGLVSGTGSPHLYDQAPLFTGLRWRPFTFDRPGATESPRPGVTITRDEYGIPSVRAGNELDAWFGAGYAVAQDRLFQMEAFRHATKGALAELTGSGALGDDLVSRRDYYTAAERQRMLEALPAYLRARSAAYRDGVNAWIAHVRTSPLDLPGEYAATLATLSDWTLDDTAAIGIFLARTVPSGDGRELQNTRALRELGPRSFAKLLPLRTPGRLTTIPRSEGRFPSQPGRTLAQERAAFRRSQAFVKGLPLPGDGGGAPATAAARTAHPLAGQLGRHGSSMFGVRGKGRRAYLFNGPQLGFSVPELFVELEVHYPGLDARGVTAAGVPLVAIGHNGHVAWGFTSGLSDEDDLYAEKLVPGEPEKYLYRGKVRQMECRDEVFRHQNVVSAILGGGLPEAGSRTERICRTVHGPVQARAGDVAYARRYAIWGRELETFVGLDKLMHARSIRDVDAAMREVTWNENVMAADSQGNIGYWHPGLHPLRPLGYDERLPYPGTGEAEWRGLIDRRLTPHVINPRQGWLANWNNPASAGWTLGDLESTEKGAGPYHRVGWLMRLVKRFARSPSFAGSQDVIARAGTTAQQRPLAEPKLRRAAGGAKGDAAAVLGALLRWNGSYHDTDEAGTVDPGVAIWERFKDEAEAIALRRLGVSDPRRPPEGVRDLAGGKGSSHAFDVSNGDAYALRTLAPADFRRAAQATFAALAERFGTRDVAAWREPRRLYKVGAQGAGSLKGDFPFFDRGTFEEFVELGP
jgi:penicillin amidase